MKNCTIPAIVALFLLSFSLLLSSCGGYVTGDNPPDNPQQPEEPTEPQQPEEPVVDFKVERAADLVYFKNTSSEGLTVYSWNFGDGQTSMKTEDLYHQYASDGVYTVKLTCIDKNENKYTKTKDVVIDGTYTGREYAYITGCTFYNIPYDGYLYRVMVSKYDKYFGTQTYIIKPTYSYLVEFSELPKTYNYTDTYMTGSKYEYDDIDYFVVEVRYKKTISGSETQLLRATFPSTYNNQKSEYIVYNTTTKVGINFKYKVIDY